MCSRRTRLAIMVTLGTAPLACIPSLALAPVHSDAEKPGKVTVDFTVTTKDGAPVAGLTPDQFGVFEDGKRVGAPPGRALLTVGKDGAGNHYVVSYCSPARGGPHEVRVFAHANDSAMGELVYAFSADGFGPGCDATAVPSVATETPPEPAAVVVSVPVSVGPVVEKKIEKKPARPKMPEPPATLTVVTVPASPPAPPPPPAPTPPAADPFAP